MCHKKGAQYLQSKTFTVLKFGGKNLGVGTLKALAFCITAPLGYPFLIPAVLVYTIFMVVSDILGIFCPEIGRYARHGLPNEIAEKAKNWAKTYLPGFSNESVVSTENALAFFELDAGATQKDLKMKYKQLARKLHPDKNSETAATEQFKLLGIYYEHLQKVLPEGEAREEAPTTPTSCPEPNEQLPSLSQSPQSID